MMHRRYPNADIFVLDETYELPTRDVIQAAYNKFQRGLWTYKLTKWLRNKWDCDSFAWSFKASCTVGNALSKNTHAAPIGFICYFVDGNQSKGHAINNAVWGDSQLSVVCEIEPQPEGGIVELTKEERDSAWLVVL